MADLGLPRAEAPEQVGFSSARLERLAAVVRHDVERGLIPGAVVLLARGGRVGYADSFGFQDRETGTKMAIDSIFRVASMTKPMTSVAAMMLSEEGRLEIAAPVAQYLPEFAEMTVGVERARATRTMTVQDLMRHTSGLTYAQFGDSPVQMLW
ncbi:MAG TPA: serine hydrolase domain-containing protein, partial [Stellaceae bacterium]|nr:serine hydrolase domain-containing protein [Stellaceae bacterium]